MPEGASPGLVGMRYGPAMNDDDSASRFTPLTVTALLGAVGLAGGSLLPWATFQSAFGEISIDGMTALGGAGKWTLVCGIASAALLAGGATNREAWPLGLGGLAGFIGAVLAVTDLEDVQSTIRSQDDNPFARVEVGVGLYLCIAGGALAFVCGLVEGLALDRRQRLADGTTI